MSSRISSREIPRPLGHVPRWTPYKMWCIIFKSPVDRKKTRVHWNPFVFSVELGKLLVESSGVYWTTLNRF